MALEPDDQRRLLRATELALEWHAQQMRKGSSIPYVSHLSQVNGLVLEHGGTVDQAVAALLHDSLEDAESALDRRERESIIGDEFGERVLRIVLDCTDTGPSEHAGEKAPWRQRKTRFLSQLDGADQHSLLVVACDKRHNLHALVWDLREQGRDYLDRFNAGPHDQLWYFESVLSRIGDHIPTRLRGELEALVREFGSLVDEPPRSTEAP